MAMLLICTGTDNDQGFTLLALVWLHPGTPRHNVDFSVKPDFHPQAAHLAVRLAPTFAPDVTRHKNDILAFLNAINILRSTSAV